jgi:hypothetical protein
VGTVGGSVSLLAGQDNPYRLSSKTPASVRELVQSVVHAAVEYKVVVSRDVAEIADPDFAVSPLAVV